MALDPEALDAWGLKPVPPSPVPSEEEIGLTTSDDEIDGWEPGQDLPLTDFLMAFAYAAHGLLRTLILRTRLHLGLNRWRT